MALVQEIERKQKAAGLSDDEFARRLGVSRSLWSLTRRGKRPVGGALLRGVLRQFPDLTSECLLYLRDHPALLSENVTDSHANVASAS